MGQNICNMLSIAWSKVHSYKWLSLSSNVQNIHVYAIREVDALCHYLYAEIRTLRYERPTSPLDCLTHGRLILDMNRMVGGTCGYLSPHSIRRE